MQSNSQAPLEIIETGVQGTAYSAEIEQKLTQKNILCDASFCENNAIQTQTPLISGGGSGSGSYYLEQEATQSNIGCFSLSICTNNVIQTQGVSTGTGSGSQQQISKQYNIGCIGSTCVNNQVQTDSGTSKQYNIGCINSTCVNPGGSGNQYNIGCINDICAYSGDGSSSSLVHSEANTRLFHKHKV